MDLFGKAGSTTSASVLKKAFWILPAISLPILFEPTWSKACAIIRYGTQFGCENRPLREQAHSHRSEVFSSYVAYFRRLGVFRAMWIFCSTADLVGASLLAKAH